MGGEAGGGTLAPVLVALATALVIMGVTVAILLTPAYTHAALGSAGSSSILGLSQAQVEAVSDLTIGEMLRGPATFAFSATPGGPAFYDAGEASHLRDARTALYGFVALVAASVVVLAVTLARHRRQAWPWRAVASGAAILAGGLALVGIFLAVAFDAAFELFHRLLFPGGNYSFDPLTERMVQLYPTPFWEMTAMTLAVLAIGLSAAVWLLARRLARRMATTPASAAPESPAVPDREAGG
jgi:hypothetical protein